MPDAPGDAGVNGVGGSTANPGKPNMPELRVQMPPVPAFDTSGQPPSNTTTPQSATSSIVQSPSSTNLPTPLGPATVNGIAPQPSPAKKKLSLSDYKKRSMSKAAGKVLGASATVLRTTLPSPEESKAELALDHTAVKSEDGLSPSTPALHGHV